MKLGKDEIQKLVLGGMMFLALVYSYFFLLLGPLKTKQALITKQTEAKEPEIKASLDKIAKAAVVEKNATAAQNTIDDVNALIPSGSPVAWFPPLIGNFFRERGVDKITTRLVAEAADKNLPGYGITVWSLDFPRVEFVPFSIALSQLENEEPLAEITNISIEINRDDVEAQRVIVSLTRLVKK